MQISARKHLLDSTKTGLALGSNAGIRVPPTKQAGSQSTTALLRITGDTSGALNEFEVFSIYYHWIHILENIF